MKIGLLRLCIKACLLDLLTTVHLPYPLQRQALTPCLVANKPPKDHSNMSGDFYYPLAPLYVNVNDKVELSWWSTFAERLQFWCYEASTNPDLGYSAALTTHLQDHV